MLESGKVPTFVTFAPGEVATAVNLSASAYDGVVFEMEHNPSDIKALRDCMRYMLNRRQIATSGQHHVAGMVTPFVRIPPNGGEQSQWIAKQVLDIGVYAASRCWPHVSTVDDAAWQRRRQPRVIRRIRARRSIGASTRRASGGDAPRTAARYWGN